MYGLLDIRNMNISSMTFYLKIEENVKISCKLFVFDNFIYKLQLFKFWQSL